MGFIWDFIAKNSTDASLVRANELLRNSMVREFHFYENTGKITAKVLGNRLYTVEITFSGKKKISTSCDCPYSYKGVCKHIIAVLLKFQEDFGDRKTSDLRQPPVIADFRHLTKDRIKEISSDELNDPFVKILSQNVSLKSYNDSDVAEFFIHDYEYPYNKHLVRCRYSPKGMKLDCTCKSKMTFCRHIKALLLFGIEVQQNPGFFNFLDPEIRNEKKLNYGKKFGLTEKEEAINHIKVIGHQGNLVFQFSDFYQGLLPIEDELFQKTKEEIFRFENDRLSPEKLLPEPIGGPDESKSGFGLALTFNWEGNTLLSIDCFTAKLNKNGDRLISNFNRVAPENFVDYYGTQKKLVELTNQAKTRKQNGYILKPDHELQPVLRELFSNLEKNTFTYFQVGSDWHDDGNIKIKRGNLNQVQLNNRFYKIEYELSKDDKFVSLVPVIVLDGERIVFDLTKSKSQPKLPLFFERRDGLYLAQDITTLVMMEELLIQPVKKMRVTHTEMFIKDFVTPLSENFLIKETNKGSMIKQLNMAPIKKKLYISGLGQFVLFRPFVKYGEEMEVNILKKGNRVFYNNDEMNVVERDEQYELEMHNLVRELHPKFKKQFPEDFYHLKVNEMMEDEWFFDAFEKLNDRGIEVLGLNELEHFKYNPYKAKIQTSISSGQDWFDVHIDVKFGDLTVSLNEVKRAVLKQNRYVKLSDGSMGILPSEWLKRFSKMFRHGDVKGQDLKISSQKFLIIEELFDNIDNEEVHKALLEKKRKLKSFKSISKVKVPQTIRAELRHYQKEGVNWLNFLHQFGWGGILADDMGLGKTLQILTFLSIRKSKTPSLIVVPTTLMFNWENEIEKFCPSLPAYFHYGPNRGQNKKVFKGNDVIITTYGMVANDIEWLKEITFNYVIIDESQAIKNPQSLRFKSVCLLKAKNKIAMTGTPIENNTFDLYAQMHFVNPGLLGNMKSFKDQFSQPIDRDGNGQVAGELRKMISPFLIRRTKEQVAKELPPKTEDVLFCTMEKEQRQVYDAFRNKYRNMLMGKIEEDGLEKSKIYVIEGLMKLRQICDSPELLSGDEDYGSVSIKVEELLRNIEEKTGKHKIVVFSQFVSMLKIIQKALDHDGVLYEYLDGKSTKKARKQSVERFQEDENCRVFLISLKAGGTGLNLTAADYVFLVDPWWNPAVEEQAIDRTYRIGQDKKVFAYRMICKDTIEEKILNYQEKKKAIAADIIQAEESFVKKLSFEDIKDLFS
ncbi:MAG TPA: hypothetical protein DDY13_03765 [Cytophagales bacterium]|jgi:SNF2 family DNA or RNA helicase/uncharacterized Zn finger protein|nr:hypothetical protein [Cytophagales bacterium]